jgi:hypothetical protein
MKDINEVSPPGFRGTVKAMKKHKELTSGETKDGKEKNPFALAWHMYKKGAKAHYKDKPDKEPEKKEKYKKEDDKDKKSRFSEWLKNKKFNESQMTPQEEDENFIERSLERILMICKKYPNKQYFFGSIEKLIEQAASQLRAGRGTNWASDAEADAFDDSKYN